MNTSYHAVTIVNGPEDRVRGAIASWMTANGFSRTSALDGTPMRGARGSLIGLSDHQTKRVIEVILKTHGDFVAVSVFHHTTTFLLATGAMFGNLLQTETEELLDFIQQESANGCA